MYIIDFYKRIIRKSNVSVLIYLVLNIFVIGGISWMLFSGGVVPFWICLIIGIVLYGISLAVALSPVGEWILRRQTGCREIKRKEHRALIEPIFQEVYERARALDPTIPDDVQLYMNDDSEPNAFATGRRTICITKGMLHMPEGQIKTTLAHELGHLAHKDTDLILVVSVGNLIVTTTIMGIRLFLDIAHIITAAFLPCLGGTDGLAESMMNSILHALETTLIAGATWVWTQIGVMLVMKSSRENEYEADEFSFQLGYGNELCLLLDTITEPHVKGLFASLASSHPAKDDRIARLQSLGATYRSSYEEN